MILPGEIECACPHCGRGWGHAVHKSTYGSPECWCLRHIRRFRGYPEHDLWWREYIGDGVVR